MIFIGIVLIIGFFGVIGNQNLMSKKLDAINESLVEIKEELKKER